MKPHLGSPIDILDRPFDRFHFVTLNHNFSVKTKLIYLISSIRYINSNRQIGTKLYEQIEMVMLKLSRLLSMLIKIFVINFLN